MKATVIFLCALGFVAANPQDNDNQQADRQFQQKQKDLLILLMNLQQPSFEEQHKQQSSSFNFDEQAQNSNNPDAVRQFQVTYKLELLPRGEVFNYLNLVHNRQAIQLFDLFFFAKDYNTFYQAACWARNNVNELLFAYAISVAILNRPDTQGIVLPRQSELIPYLYVNAHAIQQAQNLKQQGLTEGYVKSNFTKNDIDSYYREDINLNQQFAYEQLKNPAWFGGEKYQQSKRQDQNQNNGENFYYYLQQLLARYNLERQSNQLPPAQSLNLNKNIYPGYNPHLQYSNSQPLPARPENYNVYFNAEFDHLQQFLDIDRRISDVVDGNQALSANGTQVQLNDDNGIQVLGNIIQNNQNSVNNRFYGGSKGRLGYLDQCRRVVGSVIDPQDKYDIAPSAVENDNTANRDPAFYQCLARVVNFFQSFKSQQKPYTQDQLSFQGVKIQNFKIDKLVTYVDNAEVDLFNAMNFNQAKKPEHCKFIAQQQQLNNEPFTYQIQVDSDKNTKAIVRVFIGYKYNERAEPRDSDGLRNSFVEIDRFTINLKTGQNQIQRSSEESTRFIQQQPSILQLFSQVHSGQPFEYNQNISQQQATFPQNLILPRGQTDGQEFLLSVAINSYQGNQEQRGQPLDNRAQGFPFDREVRVDNFQKVKNIYFQTVKVYRGKKQEVFDIDYKFGLE